jgi:hypothetical protein
MTYLEIQPNRDGLRIECDHKTAELLADGACLLQDIDAQDAALMIKSALERWPPIPTKET